MGETEKKTYQRRRTKRNDSYIGAKRSESKVGSFFSAFVFQVYFFPLNLTVGGWSITEKYLTTKNR